MIERLLLAGNSSWLNRGCEAIERGVMAIVRHELGQLDVGVLPFAAAEDRESSQGATGRLLPPAWSVEPWSMERIRRTILRRMLLGAPSKAYRSAYATLRPLLVRSTALVQIGGDNFTLDYGRPDVFFALDDLFARVGAPVVLWGASIGPFSADRDYERFAARELRKATLIIARERLTCDYLSSIGVEENVTFAMDPAFCLDPMQPSVDCTELLDGEPIAVNLSPLFARYSSLSAEEFIRVASEIVSTVLDEFGSPVLLVPHVLIPGQNDAELNSAIADRVSRGTESVRVLPPELGASEIKWCAARCRAVVASRTHLTIAGFSSAVPTLSLGYSVKARGINLEVYGHDRFVVDVRDFSREAVVNGIGSLLDAEGRVRAELSEKSSMFRESSMSAGSTFARAVGLDGVS